MVRLAGSPTVPCHGQAIKRVVCSSLFTLVQMLLVRVAEVGIADIP
jgi:hypothetical protein